MTKQHYRTRQKDSLLVCMKTFGSRHFTAADITLCMEERGERIGLTTVYRHLDQLVEQGILRRYLLESGTAACYQMVSDTVDGVNCQNHYHLKCERCGKLIHTGCSEIDRFTTHMKEEHGFTIDHARTVFYGICAVCASSIDA